MQKKDKSPWPTKDAMEQVYEMNLWGKSNFTFYSGEGSHKKEIVNPYIKQVKAFLNSFEEKLSVLDLGCGDFNIGKQLVEFSDTYIAIDIVQDLIAYNTKTFTFPNLEFQCLDIAKDDLPIADCVILRQVLQHLSNKEIQSIVPKLTVYKYVILTEHLPNGEYEPNATIISGQGIRLKKKSGVNLLKAPFYLNVIEEKELVSYYLDSGQGKITTTLYRNF